MNVVTALRSIVLPHASLPLAPHRAFDLGDSEDKLRSHVRAWNRGAAAGAINSPPYQNAAKWLKRSSPESIDRIDDEGYVWLKELSNTELRAALVPQLSQDQKAVWAALYYSTALLEALEGASKGAAPTTYLPAAVETARVAAEIEPDDQHVRECLAHLESALNRATEREAREVAAEAKASDSGTWRTVVVVLVVAFIMYLVLR